MPAAMSGVLKSDVNCSLGMSSSKRVFLNIMDHFCLADGVAEAAIVRVCEISDILGIVRNMLSKPQK